MSQPSFAAVPARIAGRVVFRVHARGSVWAIRIPRAGQLPPPACLFLPAPRLQLALAFAALARGLGWRAQVRPGVGSAVWRSGPLAAQCPAYAVKIWLPVGVSAAQARAALRGAFNAAQ
ncbi:hypothetical protein [Thiobaca trueperi]|uniref:Uncharacterized protein n=1 Tax=Thiobaca trueperi TaxID=127458 RepID=A0A4R3MZQ9_9GAMM|nr:hypothetical protein [Thiobaca trueperi]TCT21191.1 hypothetical protein EDC35_10444 [Thiobaca trueperi]